MSMLASSFRDQRKYSLSQTYPGDIYPAMTPATYTTTLELPFRETFGVGGNEVDSKSEGYAKSSRFTLAMRTVIRATVFMDFPVNVDGRIVLKEAETLCSEWPEALGESSTDQCSASALKDVKIGTFNDITTFWNSSSGLLVHDSKSSTGKLKLRGIVKIKSVNGIIAKEIPKRPDGLLSSLAANRKEDLDL